MIWDNNSITFAQSLMVHRGRLEQSTTNSTCGHSASLSPELSPIFSDLSPQFAESKSDGDEPVPVCCRADRKTDVESHKHEQVATPVNTKSCVSKQTPVRRMQTNPECPREEKRDDDSPIETEEEHQFEHDPEMDYTNNGQDLEREMSLGSSCDDTCFTDH